MNFIDHSKLIGQHAFLGASQYHWINYDADKLISAFDSFQAKQKGTELHDIAFRLIKNNIRLPRSQKTLNMYVNDAIGFKMTPEQVLYYSDNCFGTCDTISFKNDILRIHDLKTGMTPAHMEQLLVYDALFCLEYRIRPNDIQIENRIYQFDDVTICNLENDDQYSVDDIYTIMDKIQEFDKIIKQLKAGE